jgi:plasmid stabilization system protein ParE
MSFQLALSPLAEDDLRDITRWMAKSDSAKADQWYEDFWIAAESLQEMPKRCPLIKEKVGPKGLRQLLFDKYRIIFSVGRDIVVVYHIRHQQQAPLTKDDF